MVLQSFLKRVDEDLLLRVHGTSDTLTVKNYFGGDQIEQIVFSDGTVWTDSFIYNMTLQSTNEEDILVGFATDDTIRGGFGEDYLVGEEGDDTLMGDADADTLSGGAGNDFLDGGSQNDYMSGDEGDDTYVVDELGDVIYEYHGNGVDTVRSSISYTLGDAFGNALENLTLTGSAAISAVGNALDNVINGNDVSNTIEGKAGYDALNGGLGNDTYLFARGDGEDEIIDEDASAGNTDVLIFKSGVGLSDLQFVREGTSLILKIVDTEDSVRIEDYFNNGATSGQIEEIRFTDSPEVVLGLAEVLTMLPAEPQGLTLIGFGTLQGGASSDTLTATGTGTHLIGGAGSDILTTQHVTTADYDHIYEGGAGNDALEGSFARDTYLFSRGDGQDTIRDDVRFSSDAAAPQHFLASPNAAEYQDRIKFGPGIAAEQLWFRRTGSDLNISIIGTADRIVIKGWYDSVFREIEEFELANGQMLLNEQVNVLVGAMAPYSPPAIGQTTLPLELQWALTSVIGASWSGVQTTGAGVVLGTTSSDRLTAFGPATELIGGAGNDTYVIDDGTQLVTEAAYEGLDTVESGVTYALSAEVERLTLTGVSAINGTGNSQDNTLTGNSGDNVLDGGAGNDTLIGGEGNDTFLVDGAYEEVVELANQGTDLVLSTLSHTLGANLENLTLTGTSSIAGTGNELNNALNGNGAANVLTGLAGDDNLNGGAGADTMRGGVGNDLYIVDNAGDSVVELANEGIDSVASSINYTLGSNVENLLLTGTAAINGTGNSLDNSVTGNSGSNVLNGGSGADTMSGGAGNDTYTVDNAGDAVIELSNEGADRVDSSVSYTLSANVENLTLTGTGSVNATGNELANSLTGNAGGNVLNGGAGADSMAGGTGNDTYVVDNAGDVVTEAASAGTDLVQSSISYILGANVENLTLTGTADIGATGNSAVNMLTGNSGNNVLDGGAGADALIGGAGDDTYVVDNTGDVVTEAASAGTDVVQSSITYTLGNNVENLTLSGTAAINATGNSASNVLTGNSGNNSLSGAAGADTMIGGLGNDTYVVDNTGDVVTESSNQGMDLVQASVNFALSAHVENLTLTGTGNVNATGNELANALTGNTGANILDGGAGIDTMSGGTGNDTYVVDNAGDVVTEAASAGTDLVQSSVSYTLATNVENLTLTGTANVNATGNSAVNALTGNSGNNVLNGGGGADAMSGGAGDDTYVVDNTGDVVTEAASAGTDLVQSSITHTLGNNVENLTLTGSTAINGTGNSAANVLTGNSGVNTLSGAAGADTLNGGAGADSLIGGAGDDTYWLGRGYGIDTITENDTTAGNTDVARFEAGIAVDQLWFAQSGNSLNVSIIGTTDRFTLKDWYLGNQYHVEQFKTSDGKTLMDSQVQNLVSAMAAFSPPPAGQTSLNASQSAALNPVIAANWQ